MDWNDDERREAAGRLNRLGWSAEQWDSYHPKRQASEIESVLTGSGVLIPAHLLVDQICELNRLREHRSGEQAADMGNQEIRTKMGIGGDTRCSSCGYTEEDAKFNGDHYLCKNKGNAPWESKGFTQAASGASREGSTENIKGGELSEKQRTRLWRGIFELYPKAKTIELCGEYGIINGATVVRPELSSRTFPTEDEALLDAAARLGIFAAVPAPKSEPPSQQPEMLERMAEALRRAWNFVPKNSSLQPQISAILAEYEATK